jgi:membrane protease YdiL (CAAX protease family)
MSDPDVLVPASADVPPPPPPVPNTFFRGPNGIRVGWRVLIFLALAAACGGALFVVVGALRILLGGHLQFNASQLTPTGTLLTEGLILVLTAIPALIMAKIERRKFGEYGLPARFAFGKDFWIGGIVGFVAISAALLGIFGLGGFHLHGLAIHGGTLLTATAAWSVAFVVVGLAEEFSFRGYLQFTLTTGMGFWWSAILLSALFGLAHAFNPGESKPGLLSVVCFALLFCLFLRRTGNLWWAVGFHAGWDWGQTFFYGVADSGLAPYHNLFDSSFHGPVWLTGGSVGPEASVFTPVVLLVVAILFSRVYRENRYSAPR